VIYHTPHTYGGHDSFTCVTHLIHRMLQGGKNAQNAFCRRSLSVKEPRIIGLFCGKWSVKIRHPMHLRHPVMKMSQVQNEEVSVDLTVKFTNQVTRTRTITSCGALDFKCFYSSPGTNLHTQIQIWPKAEGAKEKGWMGKDIQYGRGKDLVFCMTYDILTVLIDLYNRNTGWNSSNDGPSETRTRCPSGSW